MTEHQRYIIQQLRNEGYAIAIFSPEELERVDVRQLEQIMVTDGTEAISILRPDLEDEE
jgi:hypothetical protein